MTEALCSPTDAPRDRTERERDLYRGLLELSVDSDPEPFLKNALELIVGIVGASHGYLELFDRDRVECASWYAVGFPEEQLNEVRSFVSHGIIGEAIASERVVLTPSALMDPRFRDRASVRQGRIDSVICAPIGRDPPRGVLYLQSASAPAAVLLEQATDVERFASYLAPIADQVAQRRRVAGVGPIASVRAKLQAEDFVGGSPALVKLLQEVHAVAHLDVSVLLQGETGTGKSQLARLIHRNSRRCNGPYLEVNCATIPDQLLEAELFGALPGAHSTASRRIEGKVAAASGGTLLLDEVGDLSLAAQAKLLQLLQSKEYFPLGSSRPVTANIRVIAATHVDLKHAVAERRFRQDLYYRLQVLSVRLPTLAERVEDAPVLARHFCEQAQKVHGLPSISLSPAALRAIENTVWPGNVRELANCVEAAAIRAAAEGMLRIEAAHLFPEGTRDSQPAVALTFQEETRRFQTSLLRRTLEECDYNVTAVARRLDLTRAHVYNLIKSFNLQR